VPLRDKAGVTVSGANSRGSLANYDALHNDILFAVIRRTDNLNKDKFYRPPFRTKRA